MGAAALAGDPLVLELLEQAAERIGNAIASLVDFSNPATLVVCGGVLRTGPLFLDVVTRVVQQRSSALALRDLEIVSATWTWTWTARSCAAARHSRSKRL